MRLSSDTNHPDYHNVVHFVDKVTLDGTVLTNCVSVDTIKGEAVCFTLPMKAKNGQVPTHIVRGAIAIVWRDMAAGKNGTVGSMPKSLFERNKEDWVQREQKYEL